MPPALTAWGWGGPPSGEGGIPAGEVSRVAAAPSRWQIGWAGVVSVGRVPLPPAFPRPRLLPDGMGTLMSAAPYIVSSKQPAAGRPSPHQDTQTAGTWREASRLSVVRPVGRHRFGARGRARGVAWLRGRVPAGRPERKTGSQSGVEGRRGRGGVRGREEGRLQARTW